MIANPKFGVIIPLYNKAPYIERAIRSVLDQSIRNFELIVVDDGSTDKSARIVRQIDDSRIQLIQQENRGESGARNRGIEETKADLICFLDADDEWETGFLYTILRLCKRFPIAAAYGTSYTILGMNGYLRSPRITNLPVGDFEGIIPNFFATLLDEPPFSASSVAIWKSTIKKIGDFRVDTKIGGDMDMWTRIALHYPIAYSSSAQSIYHQEAENRTSINFFYAYNELGFQQTVEEALLSKELSNQVRTDLRDFLVRHQLFAVHDNMVMGNRIAAKAILHSIKKTERYKYEVIWWRFWVFLPSWIFTIARKINRVINNLH